MVKKRQSKKIFRGGSCSSCFNPLTKGGSRKRKGGNATVLDLAYTGTSKPHFSPNPNLAYTGNNNIAKAYPNTGMGYSENYNLIVNPLQTQSGGKYPNGLTGDDWTSNINSWPGVNGISGDGNHFPLNTYDNDVSRQMIDVGPAAPYVVGGKRRYKKQMRSKKHSHSKKKMHSKKHSRSKKYMRSKKGGLILNDNLFLQDAVNVGRQVTTGLGGIVNGLRGYEAPVSPIPWKDQLPNGVNMNILKYKSG